MKTRLLAILGLGLVVSCIGPLHAETPGEHDQRMAWWREARFGMFIHWGIMSIPGKDFGAMQSEKIRLAEYEKLVSQYNPVLWNAHEVVKMAKEAGQRYLVLVAKHHDGFCMWDTKLTDYSVMKTPYRRDILRQLADECGKQGVKFCFYYSILDWHHPDANAQRWPKYVEYMKGQLRELLTGYGPIGVVWFDGDWITEWSDQQGRELAQFVWSLQPKTIINNRVGHCRIDNAGRTKPGCFLADYITPETMAPPNEVVPPNGLPGVDWESCISINGSWSWNKSDVQNKSTAECIRLLVEIASKGGNLLLNIGPHPDGSILQPQQDRLRDVGQWMRVNSEAIHGTSASPFPQTLPWGRCTKRRLPDGNTRLYLLVFDWPKDGKLVVPGLGDKVSNAYLLADPQRASLKCEAGKEQLTVGLPAASPDPYVSVITVDVAGLK